MFKVLLMSLVLAGSSLAFADLQTSNCEKAAAGITIDFGKDNSDWGTARIWGCSDVSTQVAGDRILSCDGTYPSLGPGGGGRFLMNYECEVKCHEIAPGHFKVIESETVCH